MNKIDKTELSLPIRWVNELDGNPSLPGSTISQLKSAQENGVIVVNAPRPLPGNKTWKGKFRCGIFYGTGELDRFGEEWAALDAKELRLVSNAHILRLVIEEGHRRGYGDQLQELMMKFTPDKMAEQAVCWLNMPFFAEEAAANWEQMLADA
ncbi:MAG: hypothetical protein AAGL17_12855, partial [Cyanobacteria bacterium J06576_12]